MTENEPIAGAATNPSQYNRKTVQYQAPLRTHPSTTETLYVTLSLRDTPDRCHTWDEILPQGIINIRS